MKYYINENKEIFAFELDGSQDHLITSDMKEISVEEIQAINQAKEDEYKATVEYKIAEAKQYLSNTDYKMLPNYVVKPEEDINDIITKRNTAREFIRSHS